MLKPVVLVSGSNLIGNGLTFLLLMLAGKALPVGEFASLSLVVSLAFMLANVLDFGLNLTLVRTYGLTRDAALFDGVMTIKCLTFIPVVLLGAAGLAWSSSFGDYWSLGAWGLIGAGVLNLWMGHRAVEQSQENFVRYAANNLLFALFRSVAGGAALLLSKGAASLYFAAFVFPGLLFILVHRILSGGYPFSAIGVHKMRSAARNYAGWVLLSSASYTALIYSPQFLVAHRFSRAAVSSYGIALSFLGIVALIAGSIRTVLLPRLAVQDAGAAVSLLAKKLARLFPAYLAGSSALLFLGHRLIAHVYGDTLPEAALVFVLCGAGILATVYVGFFNVAIHAVGKPTVEAVSNFARLVVLAAALWAWGSSLTSVAAIFASVLFAGELLTAALVAALLRKK